MSIPNNTPTVSPGVLLLLKKLHLKGHLAPMVREAIADQVVQAEARRAGLEVSAQELQKAADAFRRRQGLYTAADTRVWLNERDLSVDDFEAGLEEDLLAAKLRKHVTADQVDRYWQAHQADYERLRLALVMVGREELARELATQVRDDGLELADVVRDHGLTLDRGDRFRKDLHGPLADMLSAAPIGQLVGPVASERDFTLAVVEERRPAELDKATRRVIQQELFGAWLVERLKSATGNLAVETAG